jgi:DNA-binding response OmpR family regulator
MRIVIAEPDGAAADLLAYVARRRGHQPVCVASVDRVFERLPFEPDAAIVARRELDERALADVRRLHQAFPALGITVIAEWRGPYSPLAMLKAGAEDVVGSPYNPVEVIVRLEGHVAERRAAQPYESSEVAVADLAIDLQAYTARKAGQELELTRLERRLLFCLAQHYPNVAPTERLLAFGWDGSGDPDGALLKTHMSHIRRKLRDAGGLAFEIVAHHTVGYSLRVDAEKKLAS